MYYQHCVLSQHVHNQHVYDEHVYDEHVLYLDVFHANVLTEVILISGSSDGTTCVSCVPLSAKNV